MHAIRSAAAPQFEINRSGELEVFVQVAEKGSFSAAARHLGVSPSAISKIVARLEARLGAQLVLRSTRRVQLTPEGCQLYERGQRVLADLNDVENAASLRSVPKGVVRINSSSSTGQKLLVPLVARLMQTYPELVLDLSFTDHVVDLMEAQADIAIRWGKLPSSDVVARLLGYTRQVIVASPVYLAARGRPQEPGDLAHHIRIGWNYQRTVPHWPFTVDGRAVEVPGSGWNPTAPCATRRTTRRITPCCPLRWRVRTRKTATPSTAYSKARPLWCWVPRASAKAP